MHGFCRNQTSHTKTATTITDTAKVQGNISTSPAKVYYTTRRPGLLPLLDVFNDGNNVREKNTPPSIPTKKKEQIYLISAAKNAPK